jgi:hypothetical protein
MHSKCRKTVHSEEIKENIGIKNTGIKNHFKLGVIAKKELPKPRMNAILTYAPPPPPQVNYVMYACSIHILVYLKLINNSHDLLN